MPPTKSECEHCDETMKLVNDFRAKWEAASYELTDEAQKISNLKDRLATAVEALRFYADEKRYLYDNMCCCEPENTGYGTLDGDANGDKGRRASQALADIDVK